MPIDTQNPVSTPVSIPEALPAVQRTAPVGRTPAQLVRQENRWRDNYNPFRSLIISKVVSLLEAGERGEFAELQWLYRMVEKRYAVLRSLIVRRRAALQKLEYKVKVMETLPPGGSEAMAETQRAWLQSRYDLITNLREAINQLALAEFRGFAFLARHTFQGGPNDGAVRELHYLPQWNIVRDGTAGDWYWNPESRATGYVGLNPIDISTVVYRVVDMPINEIAVLAFVKSNLCEKDWIAFCELFGIPRAIVIMPPGSPPAGQEESYKAAAESVSEGASGALPNGADAKFPSSSVRGTHPFKEYIDAKREDVVLAGTGGKLTMLNEATGIGGSQGDVHDDAFDDIARGEAQEISEIFQRQFDEVELAAQFPGQPRCVYFEICAEEEQEKSEVIDHAGKLKTAGWKIKTEQLEELSGYELEEVEAPMAPGLGQPGAPGDAGRGPAAGADGNRPDTETPPPADPEDDPEDADVPLTNRVVQRLRNGIAQVLQSSRTGLRKGVQMLANVFDPDQPRDEDGKWTDADGYSVRVSDSKITVEARGQKKEYGLSENHKIEDVLPAYAKVLRQQGADPSKYMSVGGSAPIRAGAKSVVQQRIDKLKARSVEAKEKFNRDFPAYEEIKREMAKEESASASFRKAMETGDGRLPARYSGNLDDLLKRNPKTVALLKAESYTQSSNSAKFGAGRRAVARLKAGDPYESVLSDMEKEWSAEAERNVWNA